MFQAIHLLEIDIVGVEIGRSIYSSQYPALLLVMEGEERSMKLLLKFGNLVAKVFQV